MSFPLPVHELTLPGRLKLPPLPIVTHSHASSCTSSGPFWSPSKIISKRMQAAHTRTHSQHTRALILSQLHTRWLKCERAGKMKRYVKLKAESVCEV